jgi:DNA invertase Pin-like site-specific DNA recombinase
MTLGGEGNPQIDLKSVYALWDEGKSVSQIANVLGHDRSSIRKHLQGYINYSVEESHRRGDDIQGENRWRRVEQYSLDGKHIQTFANAHKAETVTGVSSKNIWYALSGGKTAGGYQWKYEDDDKAIVDISNKARIYKQQVIQIMKDGSTKTYNSAAEASRKTGINDACIRKACQGKANTAGGYKWYYTKGDDNK